jgi:hypothetical protein
LFGRSISGKRGIATEDLELSPGYVADSFVGIEEIGPLKILPVSRQAAVGMRFGLEFGESGEVAPKLAVKMGALFPGKTGTV